MFRIQINILLDIGKVSSAYSKVARLVLPVFWMETEGKMSRHDGKKAWAFVFLGNLCGMLVGGLVVAIGLALMALGFWPSIARRYIDDETHELASYSTPATFR